MRLSHSVSGFCLAVLCGLAVGEEAPERVTERRERVLAAAARGAAGLPALQLALNDESPFVRRAAVRALTGLGAPAQPALTAALENGDAVVRRAALLALAGEPTPAAIPLLAQALADPDVSMRQSAVSLLATITPRPDRATELLRQAATDKAPEVQVAAALALAAAGTSSTAFSVPPPERVPLRRRPDMVDHTTRIVAATSIPLPKDGWRFRVDPAAEGHVHTWFDPACDDATWSELPIEAFWTPDYLGVGWYRRTFDLPARPEHLAAELVFDAVDETAWVWVNGVYVGGQDIGPDGWDKPFRVDATEELRWNARNQITVRVLNTAFAGGIWKPVRIDALKLK
jgi:hypothetical protein